MNKGTATLPCALQPYAKRPDLAGWYAGENSGGVTTAAVVRRGSGGRLHQGEMTVRRVPSSAWCVLLVHTPHGRRQLGPPGGAMLELWAFGHVVHSF